jgi:hypothetical protein
VCRNPAAGEAPGKSPNGQICVWDGIHGATEEGRAWDTANLCERARNQGRPYARVPPNARYEQADARRDDAAYVAEETWVKSQARSQACTCCHSNVNEGGGAVFGIDRAGSFANQFNDRGLAQGAGWVQSIPLGGWPAEKNNGFQKSDVAHPDYSIFMSTDPARMKRFFEGELRHRNLTPADFLGKPDGFGPLTEQLNFRPEACTSAERVDADGRIRWLSGKARYIYVMEESSRSPTVPPNLDLPAGTLWRIDVPESGTPVSSGTVTYGVVPDGLTQKFPMSGKPAPLTSGKRYYLYASADVLVPLTRCVFTAP